MALTLITAPTSEPITTAEAKAHLIVTISDDDTLIDLLIKAARETGENITSRAWFTQTWELVLDGFPDGGIVIPRPPLQSVSSLKYIDTDGVQQTLDPLLYSVDTDSEPGLIVPAYGEIWPDTRDEINAVRVRFIAGWSDVADIPEPMKQWLKLRVGTMYANREAVVVGSNVGSIPRDFIDGLLDSYRIWYSF